VQAGRSIIVHMPMDSVESLEEAELPPVAARAIVRVITNHVTAAVSGLATKEDLERLEVAMKRDSAEFRSSMERGNAEFRRSMEHGNAEFRIATEQKIADLHVAMKQGFDVAKRDTEDLRNEMLRGFQRRRFQTELAIERLLAQQSRQMTKWFLGLFGMLLPAFCSLVFFMVQYMKK
jgi:hypothetical protein